MGFLKSLFGPKEAKYAEVAPFGARFEVPSGETILGAALQNDVPFPHDCTVGTCGSCKCKLKSGRVSALTDFGYTLSQQEIAAGYILACQALPKDALTEVEVEGSTADQPVPEKYQGKMVEKEALTHDILRIRVAIDRPMPFIAGQYANIGYEGIPRSRNYSFALKPADDGLQELEFFVRKVPGGLFTEQLFADELDDKELTLDGPHGNFHLHAADKPMICIAGGSGLAPLLSVLEDACSKGVDRPCAFLFGARTQADLYCLDTIERIKQNWSGSFTFMPVLSHEPADSSWTGARGLVTQFITDAMPDSDLTVSEGYMCGPPGMIDAGIVGMTEVGMKLESIHYDKFTDESHSATMP